MPRLTKRYVVFTVVLALALAALCLDNRHTVPIARHSLAATTDSYIVCGVLFNDPRSPAPITSVVSTDPYTVQITGIAIPISPGAGGDICLQVDQSIPVSQVPNFISINEDPCADGYAEITLNVTHVTQPTATQFCFSFLNSSQDIIIGVGFDLPPDGIDRGPFTLVSVSPSPQPGNQDLKLVIGPDYVPSSGGDNVDFAVVSGKVFAGGAPFGGVPPGELSAKFCISANFEGLSRGEMLNAFQVRTGGKPLVKCFPEAGGGIYSLSLGSPQ
jgi:hypothetical protein